jgi:hypothetical protein
MNPCAESRPGGALGGTLRISYDQCHGSRGEVGPADAALEEPGQEEPRVHAPGGPEVMSALPVRLGHVLAPALDLLPQGGVDRTLLC